MSYPINYPTPQGANVQIFQGDENSFDWVKPQGASFVWFTLIGAGGRGGNGLPDPSFASYGGGGGSGAVTNCMVPAFLIPDTLRVNISKANGYTSISYQQKIGSDFILLQANNGSDGPDASGTAVNGGPGGTASTSNFFSCMGFFQSIAGQAGSAGVTNQTTSTTTFLQGGVGGVASQAPSQYGYTKADLTTAAPGVPGYSNISPIIVGVASNSANNTSNTGNKPGNGFGCGGGGGAINSDTNTAYGILGGPGLAVIVTW